MQGIDEKSETVNLIIDHMFKRSKPNPHYPICHLDHHLIRHAMSVALLFKKKKKSLIVSTIAFYPGQGELGRNERIDGTIRDEDFIAGDAPDTLASS